MARWPMTEAPGMAPVVVQCRWDNDRWAREHGRKRKALTWTLTGSAYRNGRQIAGWVQLDLEGGGFIRRPEGTTLDELFAYADETGIDTAEVRARTDRWVTTGSPD